MIDPTLTISIDRTSLSLAPLVLYGHASPSAGLLFIHGYTEPTVAPQVAYEESNGLIDGAVSSGWSYPQTVIPFEVSSKAATEAELRTAVAELRTALTQMEYQTTVTVGDAPPEGWLCDPGSVVPAAARSYVDLRHGSPVWSVSIPCYPVRTVV